MKIEFESLLVIQAIPMEGSCALNHRMADATEMRIATEPADLRALIASAIFDGGEGWSLWIRKQPQDPRAPWAAYEVTSATDFSSYIKVGIDLLAFQGDFSQPVHVHLMLENESLAAVTSGGGASGEVEVTNTVTVTGTVNLGTLGGAATEATLADVLDAIQNLDVGGEVVANIGTTGGLALDATLASILAELDDDATEATLLGVLAALEGTLAVGGTVTANLGTIAGVATQTTLAAILALLPAALGVGGGLKVDGSGTALPVSLAGVATQTTLAAILALLPAALGVGGGLKVDGSGTALPVSQSGTWTVQPGNTANTTAWKVDGSAVTQPISVARVALTGAAPATVNIDASSVEAVASNSSRKGLIITNTSSGGQRISLAFDGGTAIGGRGVTLYPGAIFWMDAYSFSTGQVKAIASASGGTLGIQEF